MRKHNHTSIITVAIVCAALQSFAQFGPYWTNGSLYSTEQMASDCYSASVERCSAARADVYSPAYEDYLIGKNYEKQIAIKSNIIGSLKYFIRPASNVVDALNGAGVASITFADNKDFLSYCNLPTNSLDDTPRYRSQHSNVTGGWHNIHVMLTNMTHTYSVANSFQGGSLTNYFSSAQTSSFALVVSDIQASWPAVKNAYIGGHPSVTFLGYDNGAGVFAGTARSIKNKYGIDLLSSLYRDQMFYFRAGPPLVYSANAIFDNNGDSRISTNWALYSSLVTNTSTAIFTINESAPGACPNYPPDPASGSTIAQGWQPYGISSMTTLGAASNYSFAVFDYTVTGGLLFK